jgi:hypothetical protein
VTENAFVAVCEPLSATRAVKFDVPAEVGVPLSTPAVDSVKPPRSVPDWIDHVNGGVPPLAVKVWEYATPTVPAGRGEELVIESVAAPMVRENALVAFCNKLSATWTVNVAAPAVVGVPLITPPEVSAKPAGNVPDVTDQVYGGVPPVAVKVWEYAAPIIPDGNGDAVVIESRTEPIVSENDFVAVCDALSAT